MTRLRIPLLVLALASAVSAQATTSNTFEIFPGSSDAVSRSGLPGGSLGDVLIEIRGRSFFPFQDTFGSVGDINTNAPGLGGTGAGTVSGFRATLQDQNGSTSESFDFCIVIEDSVPGFPAPPQTGNPVGPEVLIRTSALSTPAPLAGTPVAWTITTALATPAAVIPTKNTWYLGAGLSSNAAWANDGLSVPMASFNGLGAPFPNQGDNPLDNGAGGGPTTFTFVRDVTNGTRSASPTPRTHDFGLFTPAPVLNWGADVASAAILPGAPNPSFGVAGLYPDVCGVGNVGRTVAYPGYPGRGGVGDALSLRTRAFQGAGSGGTYLLTGILSASGTSIYLNNPGFIGSICVDLTVVVPFPMGLGTGGVIPPSGELVELIIPSGPALCSFAGSGVFAAQALLTTPTGNYFSNAAKTNF